MKNIILNEQTKKRLESLVSSPSHAIGLIGQEGSGKEFTAGWLINELKLAGNSQVSIFVNKVTPENNKLISIDQIRNVKDFMTYSKNSNTNMLKVVIVDDAHLMSDEAQNSLLKILEEPPEQTMIILLATSTNSLLPTILSRLQLITIYPPTKSQAAEFYKEIPSDKFEKYWIMSSGNMGLLSNLINNSSSDILESINLAKELLQKDPYGRLILINNLDKQSALDILRSMQIIARSTFFKVTQSNSGLPTTKYWHKISMETLRAEEDLRKSANLKLIMTRFVLGL